MESLPTDDRPRPPDFAAQKTNHSFLSWWGVGIAVLFLSVQVIFSRPPAPTKPTTADYDLGYMIGFIAGRAGAVALVGLLIGWLVYLASKSRTLATAAFSMILVLAASLTVMQWMR